MYTSPLLAGSYRPVSCRKDAHSSTCRSYAIPRASARRSAIRYWRTVWRSMSPSTSPVAVRNAASATASDSAQISSSARRRVFPRTSRHVSGRRWSGPPGRPATGLCAAAVIVGDHDAFVPPLALGRLAQLPAERGYERPAVDLRGTVGANQDRVVLGRVEREGSDEARVPQQLDPLHRISPHP